MFGAATKIGMVSILLPGLALGASAEGKLEWVRIDGGAFMMGPEPGHKVSVGPFLMTKTEVTVEQYAACVRRGRCRRAGITLNRGFCNTGKPGRERHPVNCVTWKQAVAYAKFVGGRLPSEAQWEYAGTSRGTGPYPWGAEEASCARAVMFDESGMGCGDGPTAPVCSKPKGNTRQGLCDMAGNVWEWVRDTFHASYDGAPVDGRAWVDSGPSRVMKGGSFGSRRPDSLRGDAREKDDPRKDHDGVGFRVVKPIRRLRSLIPQQGEGPEGAAQRD